jgi:hypothetical protein
MARDEMPDLLTVQEAARCLRIGRGLAYSLARRWLATEGREGLPVIKLGRKLLVPRTMLIKLLDGELQSPAPTSPPPSTNSKRTRRRMPSSQLRLLDGDSA